METSRLLEWELASLGCDTADVLSPTSISSYTSLKHRSGSTNMIIVEQ
jgi:hypothetical protein